jgi:hypothetical protein
MGDDWRHAIVIETVGPGQPITEYPRYIDGGRGASTKTSAASLPSKTSSTSSRTPNIPSTKKHQWYFERYGNAFNPDTVAELPAKLHIGEIAKRRVAGKAAFAKRKPI